MDVALILSIVLKLSQTLLLGNLSLREAIMS